MKQYGSVLWKASSDKKSWKSRKDWQFLKNIFTSERGDGKRSRGVRKRMHKQTPMRTLSDTVLCLSVWWIKPFFRDWGYAKRPRNYQKHFFHIVTMTTWPCVNLLESTLREAAHTTLIFFLGIWLFIRFQGTKTFLSSSFGTASILVRLIGNTETPKKKSSAKSEKILAEFNPQTGWTTNTCEGWGPLHRLLQKSQSYRFCAFSFELDPHEKWIQVSNGKKNWLFGAYRGNILPSYI